MVSYGQFSEACEELVDVANALDRSQALPVSERRKVAEDLQTITNEKSSYSPSLVKLVKISRVFEGFEGLRDNLEQHAPGTLSPVREGFKRAETHQIVCVLIVKLSSRSISVQLRCDSSVVCGQPQGFLLFSSARGRTLRAV